MWIFPQYRKPPLVVQPASFIDIADVVEHFYNNPDKYGIDKTKIGIEGGSGGAYVESGALMILI